MNTMIDVMMKSGPFLVIVLWTAGCGKVNSGSPDATDTQVDSPADTGQDTGVDIPADTPPDTSSDTATDVPADTELDSAEDPPEDEVADPGLDLPDGWPTENPTDWPYLTHGQCAGVGGFCSGGSALLCPWGFEPSSVHLHGHCELGGWCCVTGPYSECTDSGTANCYPGTACDSVDTCLAPPTTAMSCETGRVCCIETCG